MVLSMMATSRYHLDRGANNKLYTLFTGYIKIAGAAVSNGYISLYTPSSGSYILRWRRRNRFTFYASGSMPAKIPHLIAWIPGYWVR